MNTDPAWVFAYGSLMWDPGFDVAERQLARLEGFHRSFCMRSIHHRGTVENPGLVLALDALSGAVCNGLALRIAPGAEVAAMAYLRERELVSSAYLERTVNLRLKDGRDVKAVSYIVDTDHVQYCGHLDLEEQAQIIARSVGGRGPNWEYLKNTAAHLVELGLRDPDLDWLNLRVGELRAC
ncbi:MAG: gamma-glutamylcyclotransferase [Pseudomonadota bacterium]